MNIYFACSITGGRDFQPVYQAITAALLADRHEVPTAHLAGADVKALEAVVHPNDVYERDVAWIRVCDALVAEVSTPSHGVGYEVAFALSLGKPVLCLYREGQAVSKMITGNSSPKIRVVTYTDTAEAVKLVRDFTNRPTVDL
jgi:2'-deoxynucleoside 5'-phosphate N-hydrolase